MIKEQIKEHNIVFHNHSSESETNKIEKSILDNKLYFELFKGSAPIDGILRSFDKKDNSYNGQNMKNHICLEIVEMAMKNIIIIDERIITKANYIKENVDILKDDSNISLRKILYWQNIYIPSLEEVDYNKDNRSPDKLKSDIIEFIQESLVKIRQKSKSDKCIFIIIHASIVESLCNSDRKKIIHFLEKDLEKHLKKYLENENKTFKIIVTSGRGKTVDISENIPFIPYSELARYVVEQRSKFHLVKTLYSIIMKKTKNDYGK